MLHTLKNSSLILPIRKKFYERKFARHTNVHYFRGIYNSFDDALKSAPPTKPKGYNNTSSAKMYKERIHRLYSTDYPVLYWLEKIRSEIKTVFDFGGHIGIHYYTYSKLINFEKLRNWTICEVEAVCEEGRNFSKAKELTSELEFVTDISSCEKFDLFLAKGSLQYLEWELHDRIGELKEKPKYIIINSTPLHPHLRTITLNNIGTSYCPYYLRIEKEFFSGLEKLGYQVLDQWRNEEKACNIAFENERSLKYYTGAVLKLSSI